MLWRCPDFRDDKFHIKTVVMVAETEGKREATGEEDCDPGRQHFNDDTVSAKPRGPYEHY